MDQNLCFSILLPVLLFSCETGSPCYIAQWFPHSGLTGETVSSRGVEASFPGVGSKYCPQVSMPQGSHILEAGEMEYAEWPKTLRRGVSQLHWTTRILKRQLGLWDQGEQWGMLARKMYSFPGAAVTNYHELVGLKQQDFLLLLFWGVWKSKIKVLARLVSLGASERESASSRSLVSGGGQKRLCSLGCGHVTAVSAPSILTLCCVCVCMCVWVCVSSQGLLIEKLLVVWI